MMPVHLTKRSNLLKPFDSGFVAENLSEDVEVGNSAISVEIVRFVAIP
jgi:hypothetical protein